MKSSTSDIHYEYDRLCHRAFREFSDLCYEYSRSTRSVMTGGGIYVRRAIYESHNNTHVIVVDSNLQSDQIPVRVISTDYEFERNLREHYEATIDKLSELKTEYEMAQVAEKLAVG